MFGLDRGAGVEFRVQGMWFFRLSGSVGWRVLMWFDLVPSGVAGSRAEWGCGWGYACDECDAECDAALGRLVRRYLIAGIRAGYGGSVGKEYWSTLNMGCTMRSCEAMPVTDRLL